MPGSDPFERLVALLAADPQSLTAPAADLAAELHYSRFHFERIVTAIAGETPTAFRRRILLERAAYRMIRTDRTLLDVAQEADFTSNAAFTRAFERAYGLPPSRWRERPTKFQLPSPNDVHFHPPAGLRLPARSGSATADVTQESVRHHAWLVGELVDRASRLTDAQLDAELPMQIDGIDGDSLRWLLSRLIGQMEMWLAAMADREYDFIVEVDESRISLQERCARVAPEFVSSVAAVNAERRWDETFVDAFSRPPQVVTYAGMVAHVLTFSAHHRLLALDRLRFFGITDLGYGDPKYWFGEGPSSHR
ncbi:MAG TPA: helix-turn-helix domain-containing protein [Flexivirga sp.]|uniref:helix-turn-helix domain-containing protein n=1 Tax=Flexivirga sp. TaxID=1962927 RepID=UPI002BFC60A7|nr:helix-turn-helix domain-containing protein [Flexivirga sp.]HWC22720.1 helix-turn-helix domain-containing protein [Flexivirga sp.]